jgi:nitrous oxidase accessory protein NosD
MPLRLFRGHRSAVSRALGPVIAAAVLATAMVAPVSAAGRTFYVATNGSDTNSGSISSPWRSFHASLKKLRAGDTLYVRGGSYTFKGVNYTTLAGTSTNRILISAYPGERPIFTGTSTPADFLYFSSNSAYVTLRGLTIQGGGRTSDSNGSSLLGFVGNANHIRIEKNRLIGSSSWGQGQHLAYVAAPSVNDIVFRWNTFDGKGCSCNGLLNFYHDPNAVWVRVKDNIFRNGDQGVVIWANVSGLKIWDNTFASLRIGIQHDHSNGTLVTENTATNVRYPMFVGSRRNLSVYGNSW